MNYKIIGKYIKDLDFKIPNPKIYSFLSNEIPNYKINIDIKSNQIKEKIIEIETTLSLVPNRERIEKVNTKLLLQRLLKSQIKKLIKMS